LVTVNPLHYVIGEPWGTMKHGGLVVWIFSVILINPGLLMSQQYSNNNTVFFCADSKFQFNFWNKIFLFNRDLQRSTRQANRYDLQYRAQTDQILIKFKPWSKLSMRQVTRWTLASFDVNRSTHGIHGITSSFPSRSRFLLLVSYGK
jgi:hypothetical protein